MTITTIQSNQSVYTNITIEEVRPTYHIVRATSERFGENEVMYEGTSHKDALNYVKRLEEEVTPLFELITEKILVKGKKVFGTEGSVEGDDEGNSIYFDTNKGFETERYKAENLTAVIIVTNEELTIEFVGDVENILYEETEFCEGEAVPFKRLTANTIEKAFQSFMKGFK